MRGRPVFKHEHWNHYNLVMYDSAEITNNKSESFNSQMKITIPMAPNIFAILQGIQDEDNLGHGKLAACLAGNNSADPNPGRTRRYIERNDKLKRLCFQYGTVKLGDYIDVLCCLYNSCD